MGGREISILGMADHARGFRRIAVAAAKITVVAPVPGTCNWVAVDEREFVYSLELGRHRCRLRVLGRASTVASCLKQCGSHLIFETVALVNMQSYSIAQVSQPCVVATCLLDLQWATQF